MGKIQLDFLGTAQHCEGYTPEHGAALIVRPPTNAVQFFAVFVLDRLFDDGGGGGLLMQLRGV
jgi:hypothetical protein